ncbi:hypothetical protein SSX86_000552 [Deinandra increscens subsp. villosa]|uniref:Ubiquitin-like protease family profile domain-containing protein n=1 Tax=Deinandra increscens subsp. villosa TaxID=3103831 RepID=A0AAP0DTK7_9ASTR
MKLSNTKNNNDKSTPFLVDEMESEESEDNLTLNQQFKKTRKMKKIKLDNQEQEVSNKKKRKKFDVEKTDLDNQEQEVSNKKKRKKFDVEKTDLDDQENKEDKAGKSKEGADKKKRKVAQEPRREPIHHKYSGKKVVMRCSTGNLISVINALTDEQRKAVKDMGFKSILKLSIHSIPTSLGFYILRNYDPSTNEIYDGEDRILISSELIQEVFQIPNGGKPVLHCEKPQITNPVVAEFRSQFHLEELSNIFTIKRFSNHMIQDDKESGRIFKINFLVMLFTVIGEAMGSNKINQRFLMTITQKSSVKKLNWCDYIIYCLKKTRRTWKGPEHYCGPLLVLVVLYVYEKERRKTKKNLSLRQITYSKLNDYEKELDIALRKEACEVSSSSEKESEDEKEKPKAKIKKEGLSNERMIKKKGSKISEGLEDATEDATEESEDEKEKPKAKIKKRLSNERMIKKKGSKISEGLEDATEDATEESEDEKEKPKAKIKKGLSNERMIKKKGSKISEGLEDATEDATEDLPATEEVWAKMLEKELQDFDKHANKICLLLGKASKDYPEGALIVEKHDEWKFLLKKYFESVGNEKHGAANEQEVDECFIGGPQLEKNENEHVKDDTKDGEPDDTHVNLNKDETKEGKTDETEESLKKDEAKDGKTDETKEGETDETHESLKQNETKDGKTDDTESSLKKHETKDMGTDEKKDEEPESSFFSMTSSMIEHIDDSIAGHNEKKISNYIGASGFDLHLSQPTPPSQESNVETSVLGSITEQGNEVVDFQEKEPLVQNIKNDIITNEGKKIVDDQEKETVDKNVNNNNIVLYNKETEMKKLVSDLVENINKDDILNKKESEVKKTEVAKIAKGVLENEKAKKDVFEKLKRPTIVIKTKDLQLQKKEMAEGGKIVGTHIDQLKAKKQFNVPNAPKEVVGTHIDQLKAKKQFNVPNAPKETADVQKKVEAGEKIANDLLLMVQKNTLDLVKEHTMKEQTMKAITDHQMKAKKNEQNLGMVLQTLPILQPEVDQFITPQREVLCMAQPLSAVKPIVIDERPKRKRAKAGVLCSPFMERPVVLEEKRTKTKNDISQFIFAAHGPTWDILFSLTDCITVLKFQMETMRMGIEVHVDVINAWSHILNHEEQFRDKGNPNRLFCTSPMIHRDTFQKDESIMLKEFTSNMNELLRKERLKDITEHEMVIVPMIQSHHFYMVSFNLKEAKAVIIDNSASKEYEAKYQGNPEKLKITFEKYLESISHPKAKSFKKSTLKRLEMDWRTENNHIDCGIFLMRHMETYLGIDDWNCGFDEEENGNHPMLIEDLRRKYIAKILLHDTNESKEFTVDLMKKYAEIPGNQKRKLQMTSIRRITERLREELN